MSTKYLLPCPCGQKTPIEVSQSGQSVQCVCGRSLEVPTMRGIRSLDRAAEDERAPRSRQTWGVRQALVLAGMLVALLSALTAAGLYLTRPQPPKPPDLEAVRKYMERQSLAETYFLEWKKVLSHGLPSGPQIIRQRYTESLKAHDRWIGVAAVFGLMGLACAASSLLVPKPGPRDPGGGS